MLEKQFSRMNSLLVFYKSWKHSEKSKGLTFFEFSKFRKMKNVCTHSFERSLNDNQISFFRT